MGLVQGAIEDAGIATVSLSLLPEVTRKVRPPRSMFVPFRFGYPLGEPFNKALQGNIILKSLELLLEANLPIFANFGDHP